MSEGEYWLLLKDYTWKARVLLEGMLPINQRCLGEVVEEDSAWRLVCLHGMTQLHIPNGEPPVVGQTSFQR